MRSYALNILACTLLTSAAAMAQPTAAPQSCAMPQLAPASREANIFTPAQSVLLGAIVMRSLARQVDPVGDAALTSYLPTRVRLGHGLPQAAVVYVVEQQQTQEHGAIRGSLHGVRRLPRRARHGLLDAGVINCTDARP